MHSSAVIVALALAAIPQTLAGPRFRLSERDDTDPKVFCGTYDFDVVLDELATRRANLSAL